MMRMIYLEWLRSNYSHASTWYPPGLDAVEIDTFVFCPYEKFFVCFHIGCFYLIFFSGVPLLNLLLCCSFTFPFRHFDQILCKRDTVGE